MYGVDLAVWLNQHRYQALLELIDQLPSASRFREAILNDPVEAAAILANRRAAEDREMGILLGRIVPDDDEPMIGAGDESQWRPRVSEWDTSAILAVSLEAALYRLESATVRAHFDKSLPPARLPAPRTLVDVLDDEFHRSDYDDLIAMMQPPDDDGLHE